MDSNEIVLSVVLGLFLFAFALPIAGYHDFIMEDLKGSLNMVSISVSLRCILACFSAPFWGAISDHFGKKMVLLVSLFWNALASFLSCLSSSLVPLMLSRIILGLFSGFVPVIFAFLIDTSPTHNLEAKIGVASSIAGFSVFLGILIGGVASSSIGNSSPFLIAGICNVLSIFLVVFLVHEESNVLEYGHQMKRKSGRNFRNVFNELRKLWMQSTLLKPLRSRLFQEIALNTISCTIFELARTQMSFSAQERGFLFAFFGMIIMVCQAYLKNIIGLFQSPEYTMIIGLCTTAIFSSLIPVYPSVMLFILTCTLQQLSSSVLAPTSTIILSKSTPSEYHGSLMGLLESLVNVGGTFGPLLTGYFLPINIWMPFLSCSLLLGLSCILLLPGQSKQQY